MEINKKSVNSRYVAHFDVIGFKAATRKSVDLAWGMLCDAGLLREQITAAVSIDKNLDGTINNGIRSRIFSDTVLFFTQSNTSDDLKRILKVANYFFCECLSACVPIRGGISHGDFYFDEEQNLYCGVPFVNAHELGDEAQWMGIVLDDVVGQHYMEKLEKRDSDKPPLITKWDVPLKEGKIKSEWVVNWPCFMKLNQGVKLPLIVDACYETFGFKKIFGEFKELPDDVRLKYENTVNFFNRRREI